MEVQLHAAKGAGAKGKRFHSGATKLRRMVNSCLKGHLIFLGKPAVIPEIERGRYFFLSNYLSSFWCAGDLSMHISSCLRAQRKELPPPPSMPVEETPPHSSWLSMETSSWNQCCCACCHWSLSLLTMESCAFRVGTLRILSKFTYDFGEWYQIKRKNFIPHLKTLHFTNEKN